MPNFDTAHALRIEQPVTSLSISPTGKSVVLAAKRGLLIVDLENLDNPPREIKHNTKWEVTDVQWNPHVSRKAWIASTSNQKVLVWNLDPTGTATAISSVANVHHNIEHILQSHQRAVSDLHWSFFHPDILATCSYDNYVHLWDLRVDGKSGPAQSIRPFASFCSWTTGATQVKWSRLNENMLASSHDTDLRIWDTRKGSKEVTLITAHRTKINGIDWSPHVESEVITSSQDQTVKFWNINQPRTSLGTITTGSPIWRSRFTPFGSAIVTMPQRKENTLTLWSCDRLDEPVTTFAGHTDVVREFVWRVRGGNPRSADAQFQLVTWSKDQTLRLWPVDNNTLEAVGYQRPTSDKPYLAGASRHPRNIVGSVSQNPSPLPLPSMLQSVASAPSMTLLQQSAALRPGFSSIAASASSQRISTLGRDAVRQVDTAIESNDPLLADAFEPKIANLIKKFPNVTLEKLDKPTRTVYLKIRTTAGWGDTEDGPKQDFVDLNVDIIFPSTRSSQSLYSPRASAPIFDIARSSPISPQCRSHLVTSLSALVRELTKMGEPCLEHCVRFLSFGAFPETLTSPEAVSQRSSGQSSPALSMKALAGQMSGGVVTLKEAPSLDSLADPNRSLNSRSRGKPGTGNDAAKAKNTPYPRLCGASFSKCGKLVCFFSSFPHPKTTAFTNRKTAFHFDNHPKTFAHFESFREFLRKQQPRRMASIPKISDTLGDFETQHHVHAHPHAVDTGMDQSEFSGALAENMANFTIDVEFEDDVFSPPRTHGSLQQPQGATSREDRESAKGLQPITTAKRPSLSVSSASAFIRPVIISPLSPLPRPVRRESADAETRVGSVPTRALRERQLSLDEAVLFASGGVSLQQTPLMLEPIFGTNSSAFFASVPPPLSAGTEGGTTTTTNTGRFLPSGSLAGNIATVSHSILGDDDDDDGSSDKSGRGTGGVLLSVSGRNSTGMFPGISDAGGTTTSESADKTSTTRSSDSDTGEAEPVATESIAEKGPQTGAQSLSSERNADTVKKGIGFAVTVKDASDLLPVNRALAEKLRVIGAEPSAICIENSRAAAEAKRPDLEQIWKLAALFLGGGKGSGSRPVPQFFNPQEEQSSLRSHPPSRRLRSRREQAAKLRDSPPSLDKAPTLSSVQSVDALEQHPSPDGMLGFGQRLIPLIFTHLLRVGDIQSLTLLLCIVMEPFGIDLFVKPEPSPEWFGRPFLSSNGPSPIAFQSSTDVVSPAGEKYGAPGHSYSLGLEGGGGGGGASHSAYFDTHNGGYRMSPADTIPSSRNSFSTAGSLLAAAGTTPGSDDLGPAERERGVPGSLQSRYSNEGVPGGESWLTRRMMIGATTSAPLNIGGGGNGGPSRGGLSNNNGLSYSSRSSATAAAAAAAAGMMMIVPGAGASGNSGSGGRFPPRTYSVVTPSLPRRPVRRGRGNASIIPSKLAATCLRAMLCYADMLYDWGLLERRAEILKFLPKLNADKPTLLDNFGLACPICQSDLESPSRGAASRCQSCDVGRSATCVVCRLPYNGHASVCFACGHGGHYEHMRAWFGEEENAECPTGCGCECRKAMGDAVAVVG